MERPFVSAILPAFNEADIISNTIKALKKIEEINEIIVVDDGSIDNTAEVAKDAGAILLKQKENMGKGAAMTEGAKAAKGDILVFIDADLGASAEEARKLLVPLLRGEADVSIAKFPKADKKGGFGLVKRLARWSVKYLGGLDLESSLSGQRAITRQVLNYLGSFDSGFGAEVGMTIELGRGGFRLVEVQTEMTHKESGRDLAGFIHRGRQFFHIVLVILRRFIFSKRFARL